MEETKTKMLTEDGLKATIISKYLELEGCGKWSYSLTGQIRGLFCALGKNPPPMPKGDLAWLFDELGLKYTLEEVDGEECIDIKEEMLRLGFELVNEYSDRVDEDVWEHPTLGKW